MEHARRARERDLQVPRDLPQPKAQALGTWYVDANRIRTSKSIVNGCDSNNPTPRNSGHPRLVVGFRFLVVFQEEADCRTTRLRIKRLFGNPMELLSQPLKDLLRL